MCNYTTRGKPGSLRTKCEVEQSPPAIEHVSRLRNSKRGGDAKVRKSVNAEQSQSHELGLDDGIVRGFFPRTIPSSSPSSWLWLCSAFTDLRTLASPPRLEFRRRETCSIAGGDCSTSHFVRSEPGFPRVV